MLEWMIGSNLISQVDTDNGWGI